MEFKYILNENTFKALQDISSPEERWNISYRSFKGLYPGIKFLRIETREDMKLKWIISDIFEADRFDFIHALEKIDYESKESESSVLKKTIIIADISGKNHECYILSEKQRNAPEGISQRHYSYWDISTFEQIFPAL